jgi:hypothetical protein
MRARGITGKNNNHSPRVPLAPVVDPVPMFLGIGRRTGAGTVALSAPIS